MKAAKPGACELQAGTLMFSTNVPSGFAAQKYACYESTCLALCK